MAQTGKAKDEGRIEIIVHGSKQEEKKNQVAETKIGKTKFKHFDVIEDSLFSDHHHYDEQPLSLYNYQTRERISHEWNMLKNGLPESIFVRANKGRPDLLRVVIIGPQGTPLQDGLFFMDIQFPSNYPKEPPNIHYHSCGGNAWYWPDPNARWSLSESNVLKHLLSIHRSMVTSGSRTISNEVYALYKLTWKSMVSVLNKPPNYFQEFVAQHFLVRAQTILTTCKSYISGRAKTPNSHDYPTTSMIREGLWQEDFDDMKRLYEKLVTAFQNNGSYLDDLSKLGIEFHGEKRTSTGDIICWVVGACIFIVVFIVVWYYLIQELQRQYASYSW